MPYRPTASPPPGILALPCRPLAPFHHRELAAVRMAFRDASDCVLQQAWLPEPEPDFDPASVRVGWLKDDLWVLAELTDRDMFSQAAAPNQRCWELGDAFEMFLRAEGREAYVELQVTPNNQHLQLCYAGRAALDRARETGDLGEALIRGEAFCSTVWMEEGRWVVLAGVPAALVCGAPAALPGQRWRFSFSRYDYTRGLAEPVISSTSPHARADFHRQEDWGLLLFEAS